jgi:Uma2 family endonuclease
LRLVWVIDPANRRATVYRSPTDARNLGADGLLTGDEIVPGFSCRLEEIL